MIAYTWLDNKVIFNSSVLLLLLTYDSLNMRGKLIYFFLSFSPLYVCLFHAFRFYFFKSLPLLIVCPLLLHSYPFLTWPHFSCPSVLFLISFDTHLLSPIFVLTLFFVSSSFFSQRSTNSVKRISLIWVQFIFILHTLLILWSLSLFHAVQSLVSSLQSISLSKAHTIFQFLFSQAKASPFIWHIR